MLQAIPPQRPQSRKENAPPPQRSNRAVQRDIDRKDEDEKSQTRILQLRKARFNGTTIPARNTNPLTGASSSPSNAGDCSSPSPAFSSPLEHREQRPWSMDAGTYEAGALQEITNLSLRRRSYNSARQQHTTSKDYGNGHGTTRAKRSPERHASVEYPALATNTFVPPPSTELAGQEEAASRSPRSRTASHKTHRSRRSRHSLHDEEATRYIEHLESQLAALQTQLQSLTSPSTSRTHSAKLRAMNNESRLLRQEVSDWEIKFSERLKDQTDQHEVVVGSLRAQVRSLEREAEVVHERLEILEVESEQKDERLEAADAANQNLERRLEFMSELLATSPGKLELSSQAPLEARRRSPTKTMSLGLPLGASAIPRLSPPRRPVRKSYTASSLAEEISYGRANSPESPTAGRRRQPHERGRSGTCSSSDTSAESLLESETDASESTLVQDRPLSPTHHRLSLLRTQTERDTRPKPMRQMRRFHGGATGPRTLILPATSSGANVSASAPVSAHPTPPLETDCPPAGGSCLLSEWPASSKTSRRRSATWDDDDGFASWARRSASIASVTPIATQKIPPLTPGLSNPHPHQHETGSAQTPISQASVGFATGRSLFEEFKSIQNDEASSSESDTDGSPQTDGKHQGSPLPIASPSAALVLRHASVSSRPQERQPSLQIPTSQPQVQHKAHPVASASCLPAPLRLVSALAAALARSLDRRAPLVRTALTNVWDVVTLSRPVLEFRWWLIKLLIGDLRKREGLWPPLLKGQQGTLKASTLQAREEDRYRTADTEDSSRINASAAASASDSLRPGRSCKNATTGHAVGTSEEADTALSDVLAHLDKVKAQEEASAPHERSAPPPTYWLRFGLTLVFAVGIAIKDGPSSLFLPRVGRE